jgi:hypothetical protein
MQCVDCENTAMTGYTACETHLQMPCIFCDAYHVIDEVCTPQMEFLGDG